MGIQLEVLGSWSFSPDETVSTILTYYNKMIISVFQFAINMVPWGVRCLEVLRRSCLLESIFVEGENTFQPNLDGRGYYFFPWFLKMKSREQTLFNGLLTWGRVTLSSGVTLGGRVILLHRVHYRAIVQGQQTMALYPRASPTLRFTWPYINITCPYHVGASYLACEANCLKQRRRVTCERYCSFL